MDEKESSKGSTTQEEMAPLTLTHSASQKKKAETQVLQSFSHGRSKAVMVEVKRKRTMTDTQPTSSLPFSSRLTTEEHDTRLKAVKDALQIAAQERQRAQLAQEQEKEREYQKEEEVVSTSSTGFEIEEGSKQPPSPPTDGAYPVLDKPRNPSGEDSEPRKKTEPSTSLRASFSKQINEDEDQFEKEGRKKEILK